MDYLDSDIKYVSGVGEVRAKLLERELGIRTLGDMLRHFPFRYIDRTRIYRIAEITDGAGLAYVQFRARVTGVGYAGEGRRRRFTAYVQDPSDSAELVWFQGIKWIEKRVEVGREYLVFGRRRSTAERSRWPTPNWKRWNRPFHARPRAACRASTPRPRNSRTSSARRACTRSSATSGGWSATASATRFPNRCARNTG